MSSTSAITISNVSSDALDKQTAWIAKRDTVVQEAIKIDAVTDDATLEKACWVQNQLGSLLKEIEKARMQITRPLDEMKKNIMAREKELSAVVTEHFERVKRMNTAYATKKAEEARAEQERIAMIERERAEQEAHEQMERERAERERVQQEQAKAQSLFGNSAVVAPVSATQPPVAEAPRYTPVIHPQATMPTTSQNSFVETWKFEVLDASQVSRYFLSVDETKIRQFLAEQKKQGMKVDEVSISGVRVYAEFNSQAKRHW